MPELGRMSETTTPSEITTPEASEEADFLTGTNNAGSDRLSGLGGDDVLEGGLGGDWLEGGEGADVFRLVEGDLVHIVDLQADDRLYLPTGARFTEVWGDTEAGTTTLLAEGAGGERIAATYEFSLTGAYDRFVLQQDEEGLALSAWSDGAATNARLLVWTAGGTAAGGAGDDLAIGGEEADTLLGGTGADEMIGGAGGDWIEGGEGDDVIWGDGWYDPDAEPAPAPEPETGGGDSLF